MLSDLCNGSSIPESLTRPQKRSPGRYPSGPIGESRRCPPSEGVGTRPQSLLAAAATSSRLKSVAAPQHAALVVLTPGTSRPGMVLLLSGSESLHESRPGRPRKSCLSAPGLPHQHSLNCGMEAPDPEILACRGQLSSTPVNELSLCSAGRRGVRKLVSENLETIL